MSNKELYSPKELAKISGWPERRIRKLVSSGQLMHIRIGTSILLPQNAISEFVDRNMVIPNQAEQLRRER